MVTNFRRAAISLPFGEEIVGGFHGMSKKELVLRAIRGEAVERIPVGFWLHLCDPRRKRIGSRQSGCT